MFVFKKFWNRNINFKENFICIFLYKYLCKSFIELNTKIKIN